MEPHEKWVILSPVRLSDIGRNAGTGGADLGSDMVHEGGNSTGEIFFVESVPRSTANSS
jgi:hypothetical protein